jgi:hypothetical protein
MKGLRKYGDALERLRLKVHKVIDRHGQRAEERAAAYARAWLHQEIQDAPPKGEKKSKKGCVIWPGILHRE